MSSRSLARVELDGPAGRLEGLLHRPPAGSPPRLAAVVSHPHPLFGGTMDNKVVYRVARGLEDAGAVVLRYNFRGAGASAGVHDGGRGEQDDLRAAVRFLRASGGEGLPLLLAGFSFGCGVSLHVAATLPEVAALLLVGLPAARLEVPVLAAAGRPVAVIQGEHDEYGPLPQVEALLATCPAPWTLHVIRGAGHFFDDAQQELQAVATRLGCRLLGLPEPAGGTP